MNKILRKIRDIIVIIIILFIINNLYFVNISLAIKSVDEIKTKFEEVAKELYEDEWEKKLYKDKEKTAVNGEVLDEIVEKMMGGLDDKEIKDWQTWLTKNKNENKNMILEGVEGDDAAKKIYTEIFNKLDENSNNSAISSNIKESEEELMNYDIFQIQNWLYYNSDFISELPDSVRTKWQELINNEDEEYEKVLTQSLLNGESMDEAKAKAERAVSGKADSAIYKYPSRDDKEKNNSEQSLEDMVSDANSFINSGELKLDQDALSNFSKTMYNILLAIGVVVAVIVGAIIGIKLMTSSIEEKAEAKKLLVPYIVGCAVVFGGFGIWKIVVTMLQHI